MQGTQYATKRSILCRGAFCGPTVLPPVTGKQFQCFDFNVYKHENVNMVIISW